MGIRRHTWLGAVIGFGAGAVMGATYGSGITSWDISPSDGAIYLGIAFGLGGGLLGAVVGDLIRTEGWRPTARWSPGDGGTMQLGVRIGLPD